MLTIFRLLMFIQTSRALTVNDAEPVAGRSHGNAVTMTTTDGEIVAGRSHGNSHVMQMTSELHLHPSQQLQSPAVCLPLSVQRLTYKDDEFHDDASDDEDDDDDDDDDAAADDGEPQVMRVNS